MRVDTIPTGPTGPADARFAVAPHPPEGPNIEELPAVPTNELQGHETASEKYWRIYERAQLLAAHSSEPLGHDSIATIRNIDTDSIDAHRALQDAVCGQEKDEDVRSTEIDRLVDKFMRDRFGEGYPEDARLIAVYQLIRSSSIDTAPPENWGDEVMSAFLYCRDQIVSCSVPYDVNADTELAGAEEVYIRELTQQEESLEAAAVEAGVRYESSLPGSTENRAARSQYSLVREKLRLLKAARIEVAAGRLRLAGHTPSTIHDITLDGGDIGDEPGLTQVFAEQSARINTQVEDNIRESAEFPARMISRARRIGSKVMRLVGRQERFDTDDVLTGSDAVGIAQRVSGVSQQGTDFSQVRGLVPSESETGPKPERTRLAALGIAATAGLALVSGYVAYSSSSTESAPGEMGPAGSEASQYPELNVGDNLPDQILEQEPSVDDTVPEPSSEQPESYQFDANEERGDGWVDLFIDRAMTEFDEELTVDEAMDVYRAVAEDVVAKHQSSYLLEDGTHGIASDVVRLSEVDIEAIDGHILRILIMRDEASIFN